MTDYITMLGSLVFVILAVFSVVLSSMDRKRMHAFVVAKSMKEHLDVIVSFIVKQANELCTDPDSNAQFQSLADSYSSLRKKRYALEVIPLANSIAKLYSSLELGSTTQYYPAARDDFREALEIIGMLRKEYNSNVERLNKQLDNRLLAVAGKLFRMKKLEELRDLSKLLSGV